jgi:predicted alpha-1,6-mannanase (GH76 family)
MDASVVALTNILTEIYIQLGAALANRVTTGNSSSYLDTAVDAWNWFASTGLINSDSLINDGLDDTTCENNGAPTYSYNQGVIIGGLVELYEATNNTSYLDQAEKIADAVTVANGTLTTEDGILVDDCDRDDSCSGDGLQFKGIFTRNLRKLQLARGKQQWKSFLETNAQSIWNNDLSIDSNGGCFVGDYWAGPADPLTFNASSQSSGLECITAALAVTQ